MHVLCVGGYSECLYQEDWSVYVRLGHSGENFILGLWPSGGALPFVIWEKTTEGKGDGYISRVFTLQTVLLSNCL